MNNVIRNRIKAHRRLRAGDLVPHELNFRLHPEDQKAALQALYAEVGFARSLLAYELPDGRLKLIDGHLRRDLDPDTLAQMQEQIHQRLLEITPTDFEELKAAWRATAESSLAALSATPASAPA